MADVLIDGTIYDLRMINDDAVFPIVDTISSQWQRILPPAGVTEASHSRPGVRMCLPPSPLWNGETLRVQKEKLYQRNETQGEEIYGCDDGKDHR
jgi:hypothetical protein